MYIDTHIVCMVYVFHTYNKGDKMKRVSLFLSDEQVIKLKQLSKEKGLSYSEIVRRAIDDFLKIK